MAFLETVTLQPQPNARPRQARISAKVRAAIDAMVEHGLKRSDAAELVGLTDNALYVAMTKPEVKAYRNTRMGVFRESAEARTIAVVDRLLDAKSEAVQLDAVKYLVPPVSKSEITHTHQGDIQGLTIVFAAPSDAGPMIDVTPKSAEKAKLINSLPKPVAHPALANSLISSVMGNGDKSTNDTKNIAHVQRSANKASEPTTPHVVGQDGVAPSKSKRRPRVGQGAK